MRRLSQTCRGADHGQAGHKLTSRDDSVCMQEIWYASCFCWNWRFSEKRNRKLEYYRTNKTESLCVVLTALRVVKAREHPFPTCVSRAKR